MEKRPNSSAIQPEIGSFEQQLLDLRQKTMLDCSVSEPPVRPSMDGGPTGRDE